MQKIHKAKKSLGQNFLKSTIALKKIVEAGEVSSRDIILEIGPGKGALTEKLLEKAGCVVAIEKDYELYELLKIKFSEEIKNQKLILINDDILKLQITNYKLQIRKIMRNVVFKSIAQAVEPSIAISQQGNMCGFKNNIPHYFSYKIIANIPYNITGAILKKFLSEKEQPEMMILMVQNEVAKRIVARDGKESILSISVKAYGSPKIIMKVPSRYFSPAPKVDSAIIAIKNISRKIFIKNKLNEEKFWEIIHTGFAHKRKKLSSNLKTFLKGGGIASALDSMIKLESLGNKRAENLTLSDWINLTKIIDINKKE
ncbi:MAG: Ribosomal RNA small subunit methyltransferase A [Candidatus Nomurabacteria bacterium GW2011_GWE1_32_28]|uniref:Ribosomal RNA small subunit methyltransferase A n=1 Tax=Candidatus Nomurabacteria bacterium GW2011_GWF1_31_48 TaxID=1618767 RepID=A0A0G0AUP6_9BACT|nr:MAG: Ribosomal RNA small subunit methyltransferase A [Candidatus Nomurabacteria bacterium GW2011_GWF2_30_133]KKP28807.1 MAG: Ribosomal RNA small subunit methyltransferase A [Candidatus Nomurabacteria bacterium GW2011_GWE2_31_40]KKP30385.1 MAG: Ribosomal RNA small subunit methyltransferase A [Candidatus Nomurabacteria bacterium GW2011_GWF1_31_48]KKP34912.1 MAG: Ribosomal RNA small subunit methyltransferase A [Candidatus Nomurabacteria bacterium GW2011_GWE1_32_28]HAS81003.1 hypothetical protei